jgi:hypothetical protein
MKQHIKQIIQKVGLLATQYRDNQIFQVKKLLSEEDCKFIIDFYEKNCDGANTLKSPRGFDYYTAICVDGRSLPFFDKMCSGFDSWQEKYPFVKHMVYKWRMDYHANLQKYVPNQAYSEFHVEHSPENEISLKRIAAWMIYLNDVNNGGETEFIEQNIKLKARAGDFYIWPAGWTHPHRGIPSPTQEKYILTGWIIFD